MHPLAPGRKTPAANCRICKEATHTPAQCPCRGSGRWCHGFHAATTDQSLISAWWAHNPAFGVGVSCGPANLVVIDIDAHPSRVPSRNKLLPGIDIHDGVDLEGLANGYHTLALLAALRGQDIPARDEATLRVQTPSGGMHVWYQATGGLEFLSSTGSGSGRALAWQVDIRAHGGYIIAPGTITPTGTYQRLPGAHQPAPLPSWLAQDLARTGHLKSHQTAPPPAGIDVPARGRQAVIAAGGHRSATEYALTALLREVTDCAMVPEGAGFTAKLNKAAYSAGGLAAAGYLPLTEAEQLLTDAARTARPTQEQRSARIIRAGLAAGARRPLHPGGQHA